MKRESSAEDSSSQVWDGDGLEDPAEQSVQFFFFLSERVSSVKRDPDAQR